MLVNAGTAPAAENAAATAPRHAVNYRADIDGLRAIAVGLVVIVHAFPYRIAGGFIGVDIFFVISGFLITSLIMEEIRTNRFSLLRFYQRRITRLYPALALVLTASLIFGYLALFSHELETLGLHIAAGATFLSNFVLMGEAGYFDQATALKPLMHLWSLGVEEQFYLVWPLALLLLWRAGVGRRPAMLLAVLGILAVSSFALNLDLLKRSAADAYYSPFARFWELLSGALLAVGGKQLTGRLSIGIRHLMSVAGLALLLSGAAIFIDSATPFPGWHALFPTAGATLIIAAGPDAVVNRWVLSNRLAVFVGLISYPLYLWHWPVLSFVQIIASGEPSTLARIIAVAAAFSLAVATYLFVERPIQARRSNPMIAASLLGLVLSIGAAGYLTLMAHGLPARSQIASNERFEAQLVGDHWAYSTNKTCLDRYPMPNYQNFSWWFCMTNRDASPTILLTGSSHANQLYPGLIHNPAFSRDTILDIGACDPAYVATDFSETRWEENHPCAGKRERQLQDLVDHVVSGGHIRFVIIAGLSLRGDDYVERLLHRIEDFQAKGVRVVVFANMLNWQHDPRRCISRPFRSGAGQCVIDATTLEEARSSFEKVEAALRNHTPSIPVFDPNSVFCESSPCSVTRFGMPLLRDSYMHLSEFGSDRVAELFVAWAQANTPDFLKSPNDGMAVTDMSKAVAR